VSEAVLIDVCLLARVPDARLMALYLDRVS
jgi:hypothetical protein